MKFGIYIFFSHVFYKQKYWLKINYVVEFFIAMERTFLILSELCNFLSAGNYGV